jgi:hypothetical protein
MKISLSPEVEQYLAKKHKDAIEVFVEKTYTTTLDNLTHIEIKFGAPDPKKQDKFTVMEVHGFKVYVESTLVNEESDIRVHLEKHLGMKSLEVDGLQR